MYQLCTRYHIDYSIFVQIFKAKETFWHRFSEKSEQCVMQENQNKRICQKKASNKQKNTIKRNGQYRQHRKQCDGKTTSVTRSFYQFKLHCVKSPRYCFHCCSSDDLHVNQFGQILDIMSSACLQFSMRNISPHQPELMKYQNVSQDWISCVCAPKQLHLTVTFFKFFDQFAFYNKQNEPKNEWSKTIVFHYWMGNNNKLPIDINVEKKRTIPKVCSNVESKSSVWCEIIIAMCITPAVVCFQAQIFWISQRWSNYNHNWWQRSSETKALRWNCSLWKPTITTQFTHKTEKKDLTLVRIYFQCALPITLWMKKLIEA